MAAWSAPENDDERGLQALTSMLEAQMRETDAFKAMCALSQHLRKLDTLATRTRQVFHLRRKQQIRQSELNDEFCKQFTPATGSHMRGGASRTQKHLEGSSRRSSL